MFFSDEVGGSTFHMERKLSGQSHAGLLHKKDLVGDLCGPFSIFEMSYESDSYFGRPERSTTTIPTLVTIGNKIIDTIG